MGCTQHLPATATHRPGCLLTERQLEALGEVANGATIKQGARELRIADSTFRTLLSAAYSRLDVTSAAQAIMICLREGWIIAPGISSSHSVYLASIERQLGDILDTLEDRREVTLLQREYLRAFDQYLTAADADVDAARNRMRDLLAEVLRETQP